MPAMNPGNTYATGNPSTGHAVIMSPFSGPKGSPFDKDPTGQASTGALNTGIGFGPDACLPSVTPGTTGAAGVPGSYLGAVNYIPGKSLPSGSNAADARLLAIGGGRSNAATVANFGRATDNPYALQPILAFGNGRTRDAGAGPAYTGYEMKLLTTAGSVANGVDMATSTGYFNRSGVTLATGQSQFGVSNTASSAIS